MSPKILTKQAKHPLKICLLSDGTPGHQKQSQGVVNALARLTALHCQTIQLPLLTRGQKLYRWDIKREHRAMLDATIIKPDLIIGTGRKVHKEILRQARRFHAKTVTCMRPSPLIQHYFDLCLVPNHDRPAERKNIFPTIGPPNLCLPTHRDRKNEQGLILIGGTDSTSHEWHGKEIVTAIEEIIKQERGIHWIMSSSPRTPQGTEIALRQLTAHYSNTIFFSYEETEPGWLETQYQAAAITWVTADSMSMIYEALSAGCRVALLPVTWKKKDSKFQYGEQCLLQEERVISWQGWKEGEAYALPGNLQEAKRCAQEIMRRWWPNRLQ